MVKYRIEVKRYNRASEEYDWRPTFRAGGKPYTWATREEAHANGRMCYPDHPGEWRVVEVDS